MPVMHKPSAVVDSIVCIKSITIESAILRLAPTIWQELLDKQAIPDHMVPFNEYHKAVVAYDANGMMIGFVSYSDFMQDISWHIDLAYVIPTARGNGIHGMLIDALKAQAKSEGIHRISGGVLATNDACIKACTKQGRSMTHSIRTTIIV